MFMPFMLLYITTPSQAVARKIANHLLKNRLGACANIFPVNSAYLWNAKDERRQARNDGQTEHKGKIAQAREWILIFKTISRNYKKIEKEIRKIHPYKVPCIMKISVSANRDYEKWVKGESR